MGAALAGPASVLSSSPVAWSVAAGEDHGCDTRSAAAFIDPGRMARGVHRGNAGIDAAVALTRELLGVTAGGVLVKKPSSGDEFYTSELSILSPEFELRKNCRPCSTKHQT